MELERVDSVALLLLLRSTVSCATSSTVNELALSGNESEDDEEMSS